jgi:hypothetical protein
MTIGDGSGVGSDWSSEDVLSSPEKWRMLQGMFSDLHAKQELHRKSVGDAISATKLELRTIAPRIDTLTSEVRRLAEIVAMQAETVQHQVNLFMPYANSVNDLYEARKVFDESIKDMKAKIHLLESAIRAHSSGGEAPSNGSNGSNGNGG